MIINRNNYEAYLIDYLDQNLDEAMMQAVRAFLLSNPDIADELESLNTAVPAPELHSAVCISNLQRSFSDVAQISAHHFEEFCIAWHEGDLDAQSQEKLAVYLQEHPETAPTFKLYKALHLVPDTHVQYPDKRNLLQPLVIPLYKRYRWAIGVAASLLLGTLVITTRQPSAEIAVAPRVAERVQPKPRREYAPAPQAQETANPQKTESGTFRLASGIHREASPTQAELETAPLASLTPIAPEMKSTPNPIPTITMHPAKTVSPVTRASIPNITLKRVSRLSQMAMRKTNRKDLLWEALDAGVRGYNRITENELALSTARNQEGKITEFALHAGKLDVSRTMNTNALN